MFVSIEKNDPVFSNKDRLSIGGFQKMRRQ